MKKGLQIEEFGLVLLNALELNSVDGGDTVNTSYHGGASQLDFGYFYVVGDFLHGLADGLTGR